MHPTYLGIHVKIHLCKAARVHTFEEYKAKQYNVYDITKTQRE